MWKINETLKKGHQKLPVTKLVELVSESHTKC